MKKETAEYLLKDLEFRKSQIEFYNSMSSESLSERKKELDKLQFTYNEELKKQNESIEELKSIELMIQELNEIILKP